MIICSLPSIKPWLLNDRDPLNDLLGSIIPYYKLHKLTLFSLLNCCLGHTKVTQLHQTITASMVWRRMVGGHVLKGWYRVLGVIWMIRHG